MFFDVLITVVLCDPSGPRLLYCLSTFLFVLPEFYALSWNYFRAAIIAALAAAMSSISLSLSSFWAALACAGFAFRLMLVKKSLPRVGSTLLFGAVKFFAVGPLAEAPVLADPDTFVFCNFAFMKAASCALFILPLGIPEDICDC